MTAHNWKRGEGLQWGALNLPHTAAQTPYTCDKCGVTFVHFYNQQPNIYRAMADAGINQDYCPMIDATKYENAREVNKYLTDLEKAIAENRADARRYRYLRSGEMSRAAWDIFTRLSGDKLDEAVEFCMQDEDEFLAAYRGPREIYFGMHPTDPRRHMHPDDPRRGQAAGLNAAKYRPSEE